MKKGNPLRRPGRVLATVAVLLVLSSVVRIGLGATTALAKAEERAHAATMPTAGPDAGQDRPQSLPEQPPTNALLQALRAREAAIAEREAKLAEDMENLQKMQGEVAEKITQLQTAEQALRETMALAESAADKDLTHLVAMYEAMKPKDAAELFETMQPEFAAGFMGRMQPAAAAGILAGLSPAAAYSISVILAGRNMSAPTE
jgi:flagellar motility protein MotE (MotC chaperone)